MKKNKKAFTLAEMMVCLAVVMVLAAILVPNVLSKRPNQNKGMMKKTYRIVETVVYELLNDKDVYPVDESSRGGFAYFDDTKNIPGLGSKDTQDNTGNKFLYMFAKQLNIAGGTVNTSITPNIANFANGSDFTPNFNTNDGVSWLFARNKICDPNYSDDKSCKEPASKSCDSLTPSTLATYTCIFIDVNGSQSAKNNDNTAPNSITDNNADRYAIMIDYDGKITILKTIKSKTSNAYEKIMSNTLK